MRPMGAVMPDLPLVLGFDTSAGHCAVALLSGESVVAAEHAEMTKGQAEALMPMIEAVLSKAGIGLNDLSAIGVGIGPGNFTGVRISVSAARGLALALGLPAVGVSVLEALAFGTGGPVLCSVDARRDMLYAQMFNDPLDQGGPALRDFEDLALPGAGAKAVIGHRAEELAERIGATARLPEFPLAEAIARIAAERMHDATLPRPAPLYLRAADAAPARDAGPVLL